MNWRTLLYDYKLLRGDPMLILSLMVPFILFVLMKYLFPWIGNLVLEQWNIVIEPWYRPAGIFFMMLIPMMFGMVYGFILLDERDGSIISAISVTPTGKSGYLQMRMGIPLTISVGFIFLFIILLKLSGPINPLQVILISIIIASQSLILLLFLGAFADNKVMGMAISKGFGLLLLGPILDFILPAPYFWIGGYSPLFWVGRAIMSESSTMCWLYIAVSAAFHGLIVWFLFNKFLSRMD